MVRILVPTSIGNLRGEEEEDVRRVFAKAKEISKRKPDPVITDGLPAYKDAFKKEFFTLRGARTRHIANAGISGRINNNVVKRLNGNIRARNKLQRRLRKIAQ